MRVFAETLVPEMKAVTPDAGFTWSDISAFPGLDTPENAEIVVLAKALARHNATVKVAFGTEAGLIQEAGMPADRAAAPAASTRPTSPTSSSPSARSPNAKPSWTACSRAKA